MHCSWLLFGNCFKDKSFIKIFSQVRFFAYQIIRIKVSCDQKKKKGKQSLLWPGDRVGGNFSFQHVSLILCACITLSPKHK